MIEFLYAYALNFSTVFYILAIVSALASVICMLILIGAKVEREEKVVKAFSSIVRFIVPFSLFALVFGSVPNSDELWRIRVNLLKFHIASPENVEKGAEEVGRIAKKLECKYLGGCEAEEKK